MSFRTELFEHIISQETIFCGKKRKDWLFPITYAFEIDANYFKSKFGSYETDQVIFMLKQSKMGVSLIITTKDDPFPKEAKRIRTE